MKATVAEENLEEGKINFLRRKIIRQLEHFVIVENFPTGTDLSDTYIGSG